jgi:hypothetical protein
LDKACEQSGAGRRVEQTERDAGLGRLATWHGGPRTQARAKGARGTELGRACAGPRGEAVTPQCHLGFLSNAKPRTIISCEPKVSMSIKLT